MTEQELVNATMQDRMREAADLRRQQEARSIKGQGAAPRVALSLQCIRRQPLLSRMARRFSKASVS